VNRNASEVSAATGRAPLFEYGARAGGRCRRGAGLGTGAASTDDVAVSSASMISNPPSVPPVPAPSRRHHPLTFMERHEVDRMSGDLAQLAAKRRAVATLVARFPAGTEPDLGPLVPRALEVRRLETVPSETPATLGDAVQRVVRTAALVAAAFGALGAFFGAFVFEGEALLPPVFGAAGGWLPGPLVGAAIGGGVLGVFGFLVGALAMVVLPSLAVRRVHEHCVYVNVRARSFDLDAVVTRIVESGGTIAALGEG
jgi:hypothetical protein